MPKNPWDTVEDRQHYTKEEIRLLKEIYHLKYESFYHRLIIARMVTKNYAGYESFISFLNAYAAGNDNKEAYSFIRKMMYELPLSSMPLHLKEPIAIWRMRIGK